VIDNFAYSPANLTVHPGQTVTVVNHDSATHTLTAAGGSTFDTGAINPGKTATFTAPATAGTYPYVCSIHASMHGTLTVG
jgi:plastocyanin